MLVMQDTKEKFKKRKKKISQNQVGSLFDTAFIESYNEQLSIFDLDTTNIPESSINSNESNCEIENSVFDIKNYKIRDLKLGETTPSKKFDNNICAIKLLKKLENNKQQATAEQQDILAKYVGWGGLAKCFENGSTENNILLDLLNETEYKDAKASMLTAYYTPPEVIKAIYDVISSFGFTVGNILEPACGIGNFFGMLPSSMKDSQLYGVELDSISARIAKQLYPNAKIENNGFENTRFNDNFFDVAIGNVPFGDYGVADSRYERHKLLIHDYFFVKALDLVRPGGIIAFITYKGTLDKKNFKFREYLSKKADLLGAIRLPNSTFTRLAGTTVTSDIIFLKKRSSISCKKAEWVDSLPYDCGAMLNRYFCENPNMVLGEIKLTSTPFGKKDITVKLIDGNLSDELSKAIKNIAHTDISVSNTSVEESSIPADENVKNYSYTLHNGELYYRKNSYMEKANVSNKTKKRITGLINIRDLIYANFKIQQSDENDTEKNSALKTNQNDLDFAYNTFVAEFGRISSKENVRVFKEDNSLPLLKSLEILDEDGNFERKADIFSKRTIRPNIEITKADTSVDALGISIAKKGVIDFPYMSELTGKSKDTLIKELQSSIFANPAKRDENGEYIYEPADEYLSGNIRKKLNIAKQSAANDERFKINVSKLEKVLPTPLDATEITVKLGATWIPIHYINEFIYELLKVPIRFQDVFNDKHSTYYSCSIAVEYYQQSASYYISNKNCYSYNPIVTAEYGTNRKSALHIIEACLNQQKVKVYDYVDIGNGEKKQVLNQKDTELAQTKQELIENRFKEWIFEDIERRNELVNIYNEKFNSIVPRIYNGSHLTFCGINPNIHLYAHQKNAIAHSLYGGNVLFAHSVGAGKSFEIIASVMEGKKLGKLTKALIVVPNHLTEQMGKDFLTLYPSANIIVATEKDFTKSKRQELVTKISTSNCDAVIIGHSQLSKIKLSDERIKGYINSEIYELEEFLNNLENSDNRANRKFSIREIQKNLKKLEAKLEKIQSRLDQKTDDIVTFEELGIDKLIIDEAHYFKNCSISTKMGNVAGVNTTSADKSLDLLYKCKYINEITNNSGLIFATGTPVSNSMTEIYTMQKYLQNEVLKEFGIESFDAWAAQFGEVVQSFELAPEGTGFRLKERFARFYNLPELMHIFKMVADIKTYDDIKIVRPDVEKININVEPTQLQKDYVESLSERAEIVHNGCDSRIDNMLKIVRC